MRRAQTATEYLIILAVVIIVAIVVMSVLGVIPGMGGDAGGRAALAQLQGEKIGVQSYSVTPNGTFVFLRNNHYEMIRIVNVSINEVPCGPSSPVLPITLDVGQQRTLFCSNINNSNVGDLYDYSLQITWVDVSSGGRYTINYRSTLAGRVAEATDVPETSSGGTENGEDNGNGGGDALVATIDPSQDYDFISTLTLKEGTEFVNIRLYRGSTGTFAGNVSWREGTSGDWIELEVEGTDTQITGITNTTIQVANNWNKDGDNYMTQSFWGNTDILNISQSQKEVLSGTVGNIFMYSYARDATSLISLSVPDTSGLTTVGNRFMSSYAHGATSLTSLSVPDTSGLESVGNAFMSSYAHGATSLTSLSVPDTSNLTSVGSSFMFGYARDATSLISLSVPDTSNLESVGFGFMFGYASASNLTRLELPDNPGWFNDSNVNWGVPESRLGELRGYVQTQQAKDAWDELTVFGRTLYINYIRDTDDVIVDP